jgi:hypothetical protein
VQDSYGVVLFVAFALVFVPTFLGVLATDDSARDRLASHGTSVGEVAVAVVAVTVLLAGSLWVGSPEDGGGFASPAVGLYLSAVGLVVALGYARRLSWLVRADRTATGGVGAGRVAVTGTVECVDPSETPFFERPAAAWSWAVAVKNRHGTNYEGRRAWAVERTGVGGVPFTLDDGSGPVRVDPTEARLELADERTEDRSPGDVPGRAGTVTDLGMGGERVRFTERVLRPGSRATVVGRLTDGAFGASGESLLVASGTASGLRRRLAALAAALGGASLVGGWLCLRLLVTTLGVSLP